MTHHTPVRPRDPVSFLTGRLSKGPRPEGISLPGGEGKFTTDGSVQFWPGNTFVCHAAEGPSHDTIRALQEEIRLSRFSRLFAFLPPSSFHMTVFQGMSPLRPEDFNLPHRDAATARMLEATEAVAFAEERVVTMTDLFAAHSITVTGADAEGEATLRDARVKLREATGILPAGFETYVFHITLAYLVDWVTEPTARALADFSEDLRARYTPELAAIRLGAVEFCNFDTMHHFEPVRRMV